MTNTPGTLTRIFRHQQWHATVLFVLLCALYLATKVDPEILEGSFLGIDTKPWFIVSIAMPVVHQVYVLLCWRYQLYDQGLQKIFGKRAFGLYKAGFTILILSRVITIVLLTLSNKETLPLAHPYRYALTALLAIPALYLFFSVKTYFGIDRAFGIDHFNPEKYSHVPFVKQGIFKYCDNGMYLFGFLLLYIPGLLLASKAALLAALFNHLYIWVHYYFTELPDIRAIYRENK